jgi:hypothetical protein
MFFQKVHVKNENISLKQIDKISMSDVSFSSFLFLFYRVFQNKIVSKSDEKVFAKQNRVEKFLQKIRPKIPNRFFSRFVYHVFGFWERCHRQSTNTISRLSLLTHTWRENLGCWLCVAYWWLMASLVWFSLYVLFFATQQNAKKEGGLCLSSDPPRKKGDVDTQSELAPAPTAVRSHVHFFCLLHIMPYSYSTSTCCLAWEKKSRQPGYGQTRGPGPFLFSFSRANRWAAVRSKTQAAS